MLKTHTVKCLLTCLLAFISVSVLAQEIKISGTIYDENNNIIPYVNIGINNKNVGTFSQKDGSFNLIVPLELQNEEVIFSCVGFESKHIDARELSVEKSNKISLKSKKILLNEVVVNNKKRKTLKLGATGSIPFGWVSTNYTEVGILINIDKSAQLLKVGVKTRGDKTKKDSVAYRINIYEVVDGMPGNRLIEKSIIKTFTNSSSSIIADLKSQDIILNQPFIISFEYLPQYSSQKYRLPFRGNLSMKGFIRNTIIGDWKKMKSGSASIFVEIEQ